MFQRIGLIGAPGSGKDIIAGYLEQTGFKKLAFADQIKEEYYKVSGFTESEFKTRNKDVEERIRKGLWAYSDKMRQEHGDLYFITPVIETAKSYKEVVISDIRTVDELKEFSNIGNPIVIIRDFNHEGCNGTIPETRIKFSDVVGVPVFFNWSDSIEIAKSEFERFYNINFWLK